MKILIAVLLVLAGCGGGDDPCHPEVAYECVTRAGGVASCAYRLVAVPEWCHSLNTTAEHPASTPLAPSVM